MIHSAQSPRAAHWASRPVKQTHGQLSSNIFFSLFLNPHSHVLILTVRLTNAVISLHIYWIYFLELCIFPRLTAHCALFAVDVQSVHSQRGINNLILPCTFYLLSTVSSTTKSSNWKLKFAKNSPGPKYIMFPQTNCLVGKMGGRLVVQLCRSRLHSGWWMFHPFRPPDDWKRDKCKATCPQ